MLEYNPRCLEIICVMCNNKACQLMLLSYFQHPNNKLEKLVCCIVLGDSLLRVEHHM